MSGETGVSLEHTQSVLQTDPKYTKKCLQRNNNREYNKVKPTDWGVNYEDVSHVLCTCP